MAKQKIKIKLWSDDIGDILRESKSIETILEDAARPVEKEMKYFVKKNNASYKANSKNKKSPNQGGQSVKTTKGEVTDRQNIEVSVENAKYSDFKYSTVQKAVSRVKGDY